MIDEFFTNLREEIDAVLRQNGKSENDITEVLVADDDDDGFVYIDPGEFLEKAADTVYITGSGMESLREMRIRGEGFEIHTDLEYCIEDSHVQYLRYRSTSSERYDGCLIRADRYVRSEMECHGLEEDARHSDASLVERKMDRLIEAAKANGVVHMTV